MSIMDFANDDDFKTAWVSNTTVKQPWYEVELAKEESINLITIYEQSQSIKKYHIEYHENGKWKPLLSGDLKGKAKVHRFDKVAADRVRITIDEFAEPPTIAEFGVYNEKR